jgi:hypothetical protein
MRDTVTNENSQVVKCIFGHTSIILLYDYTVHVHVHTKCNAQFSDIIQCSYNDVLIELNHHERLLLTFTTDKYVVWFLNTLKRYTSLLTDTVEPVFSVVI